MSETVYHLEARELDIEISDDQVTWRTVGGLGGREWGPLTDKESPGPYRIAPPDALRYEAFPVSTMHDGVITTLWTGQTAHGVTEGQRALYAESADGGASYGPVRELPYSAAGQWGVVGAVQYPDELVVLHSRTGVAPGRRGFVSRGSSYIGQDIDSALAAGPLPWGSGWHFPCCLANAGGALWAGCYSSDGVRLLRSPDRGHTWQTVTVPDAIRTAEHSEHWIVETGDGDAMLLVRYDPGGQSATNSRIDVYLTSDQGRTWRAASPIPSASGLPQATLMTDGAIAVVIRDNTTMAAAKECAAIAITRDGGKTWLTRRLAGTTWSMYGTIIQTSNGTARYIGAHQPRGQATDSWLYSQPLTYQTGITRAAGALGEDPAWAYPVEYTWGREHPLGHATDGTMRAKLWIPADRDRPVSVGQWVRLIARRGWEWRNAQGQTWYMPSVYRKRAVLWTGHVASVDQPKGSRVATIQCRDIVAVARSIATVGPRVAPEEDAAKRVTRINQLAGTIADNIAGEISGGTVEPASSHVNPSALSQLIQAHRLGVVMVPRADGLRISPTTIQMGYVREATAVEPITVVTRRGGDTYYIPEYLVETVDLEDTRSDAIHHVAVRLGFGATGDSHTSLRGTGKTLSLETGIYDTSARAYEIASGIMQRIRPGLPSGRVVIPGIWRGRHEDGYSASYVIAYIQPGRRETRPIYIQGVPSIQFPTAGRVTLTPSRLGRVAGQARIELEAVSGESHGIQYHTAQTLRALPSPPTFGGAGTQGPQAIACLRTPPAPYN